MPREIPLTKGFVALVDDEDYERVAAFKWQALVCRHLVYGVRTVCNSGKRSAVLLHRFVLGAPADKQVDHRDMDGLNCQKSNLRLCSHSENLRNQPRRKNNLSGFKGVYPDNNRGRWRASIQVNKKIIHLGTFDRAEDAAEAYRVAAHKYHGDFAYSSDTRKVKA